MIPSLVDTSLDFGLFRVVRPYMNLLRAKMNNVAAILLLLPFYEKKYFQLRTLKSVNKCRKIIITTQFQQHVFFQNFSKLNGYSKSGISIVVQTSTLLNSFLSGFTHLQELPLLEIPRCQVLLQNLPHLSCCCTDLHHRSTPILLIFQTHNYIRTGRLALLPDRGYPPRLRQRDPHCLHHIPMSGIPAHYSSYILNCH